MNTDPDLTLCVGPITAEVRPAADGSGK